MLGDQVELKEIKMFSWGYQKHHLSLNKKIPKAR